LLVLTTYSLVARAIKTQVDAFSDRRLNDGDDVWRERELELRSAVAKTANAIAVEFHAENPTFDLAGFADACGLFVSDGRDNYSDCYPGELTWERPRTAASTTSSTPSSAEVVSGSAEDAQLADALPAYNGWIASYEYPGFINYAHPDTSTFVCASSDFNGAGKLDIQIQTRDGHSFDDGENEPWPYEGRTAEKLFARLRPYLDKYQPTTTPANVSKES
jgi:hypothetical protein